jgi:hypothetical protein
MKRRVIAKSHLITVTDYCLLAIAVGVTISLMVPAKGMTAELATYDGTIQGLNCVHYQLKCPEEDLDMYIALEHDFVLLLNDGRHFVLPNLDRGIKARYLTKDVRIRGQQKGTTIWVEQLEVKDGQRYRLVWDREKQRKIGEAP